MKILIVINGDLENRASLGGSERQAILLAKEMIEQGHLVRVVCVANKKGLATTLMDSWDIPYVMFKIVANKKYTRIFNFVGIVRAIVDFSPQVVLPYVEASNIYSGLAAYFVNSKILFIWGQRDAGMGKSQIKFSAILLRKFKAFIANSKEGSQFLVDVLKVTKNKIYIIPNGVIETRKSDVSKYRLLYGVSDQDIVVTMVANLHINKDHETLIQAWKLVQDVKKNNSNKYYLFLAGRKDGLYDSLKKMVDKLEIGFSTFFLGEIDDVSQLLSETDILVHSSPSEGLSNSILEAMMLGLPVIATDIPGNRECLGDKTDISTLTPVGDKSLMADRIIEMIMNNDLRNSIEMYNTIRSREVFSISNLYKNVMKVINTEMK